MILPMVGGLRSSQRLASTLLNGSVRDGGCDVMYNRSERTTVEELAADCLDVREALKAGVLKGGWVNLRAGIRWPRIRKIRASRYLIQIELHNQTVPQQVPVSWTSCHYGGARPWLHCLCGRRVPGCLKVSADIIAARAAETQSMRAKDGTKRRGPTCRHIEPDSNSAGPVREWILYQSVLIA